MKGRAGRNVALGLAILILLGLAATSLWQTPEAADEAVDPRPAPPCPARFLDRVGQAERIEARLRGTPRGAALLDGLRVQVRYCFGEIEVPVVMEGRLLVLDDRADVAEQAARAGHLLHHVVEGSPFPDEVGADADCDAIVETAIEREAEAYALEVELRAAFELDPSRYEFEPGFFREPASGRVAYVERYLRAHPDGARNLDPLITGYRQRCEVERAEAR